jgi:hypothetical protein
MSESDGAVAVNVAPTDIVAGVILNGGRSRNRKSQRDGSKEASSLHCEMTVNIKWDCRTSR